MSLFVQNFLFSVSNPSFYSTLSVILFLKPKENIYTFVYFLIIEDFMIIFKSGASLK